MPVGPHYSPTADLPRPDAYGRSSEPVAKIDIMATDDKPKPLPPYSAPPPSAMHRIPSYDVAHPPPPVHGTVYEPAWRPPPPSFDGHNADQRRAASNPAQPPMSAHGYQLPHPAPDPSYGRPNGVPGSTHTPPESHPAPPSNYRPMNGMPHEAAPHSAPPDYRPRMAYQPPEQHSNGEPPLPPQSMPPAQYPPMAQAAPTPGPYEPYYHNQAYGMRQRKAARAQQACDQCRARKAKCDEGRPACSNCKENGIQCVYKEVPPHKQEKTTQLLMDRIQQLEDKLERQFRQLNDRLPPRDSKLPAEDASKVSPVEERPVSQTPAVPFLLKPDVSDLAREPGPKETSAPFLASQSFDASEAPSDDAMKLEEVPQEDGDLSIPVEHTTAAHKLLSWPSIKNLFLPWDLNEDYVMHLEESRGLIRIWGRGEGDDTSEEARAAAMPSTNSSSPNWDGQYGNQASPHAAWNPSPARTHRHIGGLDESGILATDAETIRRLHKSYIQHMHRLHPFLEEKELERRIEDFIMTYCPQRSSAGPPVTNNHVGDIPRGAKRKRSCETLQGAGCDVQASPSTRWERPGPRPIEKTLHNAIVLMVLALGSICEWRDSPLPGPLPGPSDLSDSEYILGQHASLPGAGGSPTGPDYAKPKTGRHVQPNVNLFPSPTVFDDRLNMTRSLSSSRDGPVPSHLRNVDVIPGLAYYAYGTQILGNLQGANSLLQVQAALLAGLYAGQLAHPFQSHGWIFQAARACQVLVRSKRYAALKEGALKDLYDFAYWTCLQLESDILAELDLPASGISRSEGRIDLPRGRYILELPNQINAPSTMMMFFYSAQIHLRKVLNRVHTDLYKAEKQGQPRWSSRVQEALSENLEQWRRSLPGIMQWHDSDPPPDEINAARMRAKYYGARYIIHRPLLYHALHFAESRKEHASTSVESPVAAIAVSQSQQVSPSLANSQRATSMARLSSEMGTAGPDVSTGYTDKDGLWQAPTKFSRLDKNLQTAAKVCIESAIRSTKAFDGIKNERPVVTNIFGTAHAQFGNMLVLSATYMSSMRELVNRDQLEELLNRTIGFLLEYKNVSPTLREDAKILELIYEKIFNTRAKSFVMKF